MIEMQFTPEQYQQMLSENDKKYLVDCFNELNPKSDFGSLELYSFKGNYLENKKLLALNLLTSSSSGTTFSFTKLGLQLTVWLST